MEMSILKIKEVWIKNFRGYGENINDPEGFYKFKDLNRKLVLLTGYNGFGKTSFFDAVEWCLTDRLSRIQDLKDIIKITNLKKSNYLKFHSKIGKDSQREIEVGVYFEDGSKVRRISKSNSIDEDTYKSYLTEDSINMKNLKKKLLVCDDKISDIFDINFLSQENINAILRAKSPAERTEEFLKLLGLKSIKNIVDKSQIKNLAAVVKKMNKKLEEINTNKGKLDNIFEANGWGNFEEYKVKIEQIITEIVNIEKECIYLNKPILKKDSSKLQEIDEFSDTVDSCAVKLDGFKNKSIEYNKRMNLLIEKFLIERMLNLNLYIKNVTFLKENDISELIKIDYTDKISYYKKNLTQLKSQYDICIKYENVWKQFQNKRQNGILTDKILKEIMDKCEETSKFVILFKKYLFDRNKLRKLSNLIRLSGWKKILERNKKYVSNINNLKSIIYIKEENIKETSKLSEKYVNVLSDIREYINDKNLDYCPVCFNKDFSKAVKESDNTLSNKEKLISIIDSTISGSNKEIKTAQKKLDEKKDTLKYIQKKYEEKIVKKVISMYEEIFKIYVVLYYEIISRLESIMNCHENHIKLFNNRANEVSEKIDSYKKIYKVVFNKEFNGTSGQKIKEISIDSSKVTLDKMKKNYGEKYKIYDFTMDILKERINSIKDIVAQTDGENNIIILKKKINELNKIINVLNKIVPYKFSEENKNLLCTYLKHSKEKKKLEKDVEEFTKYKDNINIINTNATNYQKEMIEKRLNNNQLIQFIYEKINPHPFFRKINIDYKDASGGTKWINITDKDDKNIFLDHIFSSAQLNILSLSIFLGLSLNQKISRLKQFFLDDPIQSMDDINILTFIDLLRAMVDSKKIDSSFILSTHDNNFSKLLSIKMRNKAMKTFEFIGYGNEGPEIRIQ